MGDTATPRMSRVDSAFRDVARFSSPGGRAAAATASDMILTLSIIRPVAQDFIEKGLVRRDWRGSAGSMVIDGIAQATSLGLNTAGKYAFSAAGLGDRPLIGECAKDPSYDAYCGQRELTLGMPSGHSQMAWTGFGIAVAHRLWDSESPTPTAELVALGLSSAAVSYLRMGADKHTITQVSAGAALGVGTGLAVPALAQTLGLGYNHWNARTGSGLIFAPTLSASSQGFQAGLVGQF